MNLDLWTCDVGLEAPSPEELARLITQHVHQSWDSGADVVLLPEYAWMGLEKHVTLPDRVCGVAGLFWDTLWPDLRGELSRSGKAVVLGTVPFMAPDGTLRNRAPILCDGRELFQDKMHLTPWESTFAAGDKLRLWTLGGVTFAVVICLDIEVPELAVSLRGRGVDAILVPSATESQMGLERIGRCASARAVELSCYVGVAHLVGKSDSELVDENLGRLAWFAPSQAAFRSVEREDLSEAFTEGFQKKSVVLDKGLLDRTRRQRLETNPALLTLSEKPVEIVNPVR